MNIYAFCYTDCIYESAAATLSIHQSIKGAYEAMKIHKMGKFSDWQSRSRQYRKQFKPHFAEAWYIMKMEVLP